MEMSDRVRVAILRFLHTLIAANAGFARRGVRGWAGSPELQHATNVSSIAEPLQKLRAEGYLVRDDARLPDAKGFAYVYRLTQAGARHIEARLSLAKVSVPEPGAEQDPTVYLRAGVRVAVMALRHAKEHPLDGARVPEEPEWRAGRQLTAWLQDEGERTGHHQRFFQDELASTVSSGLAERREHERGPLYRISEAGSAVQPMHWHEPPPDAAQTA